MPKIKKKRRKERKDKIPFSHVRKQIPRPGTTMKSDKDYNRRKKHPSKWGESD